MSATTEERAAYLKMSRAVRGEIDSENDENEENVENITPAILSDEKYAEMEPKWEPKSAPNPKKSGKKATGKRCEKTMRELSGDELPDQSGIAKARGRFLCIAS